MSDTQVGEDLSVINIINKNAFDEFSVSYFQTQKSQVILLKFTLCKISKPRPLDNPESKKSVFL